MFKKKRERKIGNKFTFKGRIAIVTPTDGIEVTCAQCIFFNAFYKRLPYGECSKDCKENRCLIRQRKDKTDICFRHIGNVTKIKTDEE